MCNIVKYVNTLKALMLLLSLFSFYFKFKTIVNLQNKNCVILSNISTNSGHPEKKNRKLKQVGFTYIKD